jgi:hypothetical protein
VDVIDPRYAVFAVHLDEKLRLPGGAEWQEFLAGCPYFVQYDEVANQQLVATDRVIRALTGPHGAAVREQLSELAPEDPQRTTVLERAAKEQFPLLRGDWLMATHAPLDGLEDNCQRFVTETRRQYLDDGLTLARVTSELQAADVRPDLSEAEVRAQLNKIEPLRPLLEGKTIERHAFARNFAKAVMILRLGTPVTFSIATRSSDGDPR